LLQEHAVTAQQNIHLTLKSLEENQKKLSEFVFGLYLGYKFPGDVAIIHQVIMGDDNCREIEITLHHSLRFGSPDHAEESSEIVFLARMRVSDVESSVESLVQAALEPIQGQTEPEIQILHHSRQANLVGAEALQALGCQVNELCTLRNVPGRLGFARQS
ncbi:hypothetical protein ACFXHD_37715, partial [Streptomyces hydrogenans]|uniref:hypothetical protein n=1 Tax=Streptomyces hydrogenans TaxID=1873719 RepID=UPI003698D496